MAECNTLGVIVDGENFSDRSLYSVRSHSEHIGQRNFLKNLRTLIIILYY